jgi:hypothetical protein
VGSEVVLQLHTWGRVAQSSYDRVMRDTVHGWIDCERLREEAWNDRATWSCCGYNGRFLMDMVLCSNFRTVLYAVKADLHALLLTGRMPLVYGLRCRDGRGSSVAMEKIANLCLREDGFCVQAYHHDCYDEAFPLCGCPERCGNATLEQTMIWRADADAAMRFASRLWHSFDICLPGLSFSDFAKRQCTRDVLGDASSEPGFVHLKRQQRSLDSERNTGVYRLMAATGQGCLRCMELLVASGVDINSTSMSGYTAHDCAVGYRQEEALRYVERRGGVASGKPVDCWT